jgi:sterol desaturase/sphingolipid hydroxylase (fatty acid hydroxylase superfamily)
MSEAMDHLRRVISHTAWMAVDTVQMFFYATLAYVVVSAVIWMVATRRGGRSFRAARDFIFPGVPHGTTTMKLDYRLFFISLVIWQPVLGWAFTLWGGIALSDLLAGWFGARPRLEAPIWAIVALQSSVIILARDFGFWLGHYLTHRVPYLWRLHRAHHSAEHLNLFTNFRIHPLDQAFGRLSIMTCGAVGSALVLFFSDTKVENGTLAVIAVFGFLQLVKDVLDHSEVWISLGWLNYIINAPALHQIHHSAERHHWDKNMGSFFAIWDWIFGTLYIPKGKETFLKGIDTKEEYGANNPHQTIASFYLEPIVTLVKYLLGRPVPGANPKVPFDPSTDHTEAETGKSAYMFQ